MTIFEVDGITYLDSGVVFLTGSGVVELRVQHADVQQEVALKLRQDDEMPQVRYGNPEDGRTVVHLANIPGAMTFGSGRTEIGKIGEDNLYLAFELGPTLAAMFASPVPPEDRRKLTFMLYVA